MRIFNEVQQLEELTVIGKALVKYAISIEPGLVFERQDGWWVPPLEQNYIGFQFHWSDRLSITLNLYGSLDEQFNQEDLTLRKGRFNYCRARVTEESQLMAASVCIWRANQLFHRERHIENGALYLRDDMQNPKSDWLRPRPQPGMADGRPEPCPNDTRRWYNEVREFMHNNRIVDFSITS